MLYPAIDSVLTAQDRAAVYDRCGLCRKNGTVYAAANISRMLSTFAMISRRTLATRCAA
jgi:hypothetical protein